MINRIVRNLGPPRFTTTERLALLALRGRYQKTQHVFTGRELARLRFLCCPTQQPKWDRALDGPENSRPARLAPRRMAMLDPVFVHGGI